MYVGVEQVRPIQKIPGVLTVVCAVRCVYVCVCVGVWYIYVCVCVCACGCMRVCVATGGLYRVSSSLRLGNRGGIGRVHLVWLACKTPGHLRVRNILDAIDVSCRGFYTATPDAARHRAA